MSIVTNVIVSGCFFEERELMVLDILNKFVLEHNSNWGDRVGSIPSDWLFRKLPNVSGDESFKCSVYVGAFNYLHVSDFYNVLMSLKEVVRPINYQTIEVMIKPKDGELWTTYSLANLKEGELLTNASYGQSA